MLTLLGSAATAQAAGNNYLFGALGSADWPGGWSDEIGLQLGLGHEFNRNIAVEGHYVYLGESRYERSDYRIKGSGLSAAVVGQLPITPKFALTGQLGVLFWKFSGQGRLRGSDSGTDLYPGIGLRYQFDRKLSLRAAYDMYQQDDDDISLLSVGLNYRF